MNSPQLSELVLSHELERIALFLAEAWISEQYSSQLDLEDAFHCCVTYVTTEMAEAASLIGGVAGLEIISGGGSAAARKVCRRVLSDHDPA